MKKLVFGLIATVLISTASFAQSFSKSAQRQIVDLEKLAGPLVNHDFSKITTRETSTNDYVLPFYNDKGLVVVIVGNEYGLRGILTPSKYKLDANAKAQIEEVISTFPSGDANLSRICWKCLWEGIKHLGDAIVEIIEALTQP